MRKSMRIIDLTHKLQPGQEEYQLDLETFFVDELLPQYVRKADTWYIMQKLTMLTHVGTHIESPYHHRKDGADISRIPLQTLVGEAEILNFTDKKPNETIELDEVGRRGAGIRRGDIVIIHTGRDKFYHDPKKAHERPFPTNEAVRWLIKRGMKCIGIDCTGIEVKGSDTQPNHEALFAAGIPLIENIANLDKLTRSRVLLFALPLPIIGLESCPIRLIAIEGSVKAGKIVEAE